MSQRLCVSLRDDATRQLRVPIAAAACQCDEDWHSGKLSLKILFFRSLSIKQSGLHTKKMPRARICGHVGSVGGCLDGRALAALGRNKTQSAGKKNMSGVLLGGGREERIVERRGRAVAARPRSAPLRGGPGGRLSSRQ